jgi:hypothetical protein
MLGESMLAASRPTRSLVLSFAGSPFLSMVPDPVLEFMVTATALGTLADPV